MKKLSSIINREPCLLKYINKIYYDQVFDILLEDFERMFTIDFDIYSDLKESLYEVTDKVL